MNDLTSSGAFRQGGIFGVLWQRFRVEQSIRGFLVWAMPISIVGLFWV